MPTSPPPWQISLARLEGALPYLSPRHRDVLAMRSLRAMWRVFVRDYPFENIGLAHDPGLEAGELMRSWHTEERRAFLGWVEANAPPALSSAAGMARAAKQLPGFAPALEASQRALERIEALLPAPGAPTALLVLTEALRGSEVDFLEGGTEVHAFEGQSFDRPAPKGAAWAASLAVSVRPELFGMGAAPIALAGTLPRRLFRERLEAPLPRLLDDSLDSSAEALVADLEVTRLGLAQAEARLAHLNASSRAPEAHALLLGLGPLTRAEIARALAITKRTASMAAIALHDAGLATLRPGDHALVRMNDQQRW